MLFTFYVGIVSESDVLEPCDDMPLLPSYGRACQTEVSAQTHFPFKVLEVYRTLCEKKIKNKQRWRIAGKPSFSQAWVANERINDGHAQREREASQALHIMWDDGVPSNMTIFLGPN